MDEDIKTLDDVLRVMKEIKEKWHSGDMNTDEDIKTLDDVLRAMKNIARAKVR